MDLDQLSSTYSPIVAIPEEEDEEEEEKTEVSREEAGARRRLDSREEGWLPRSSSQARSRYQRYLSTSTCNSTVRFHRFKGPERAGSVRQTLTTDFPPSNPSCSGSGRPYPCKQRQERHPADQPRPRRTVRGHGDQLQWRLAQVR